MPSSVNLGETLEGVVDDLVKNGRFGSQEREGWLEMVEKAIARGRAQVAAGEWIDMDEAFDQLAARHADR